MALLDATVVNVATPAIHRELRTTGSALQLIVSGYTMAYATLLITGARLGARHGFRTVFLLGLAVFTLASAACGLAPGAAALIGARVVQGLGAGLMVPQIYSLIQLTFEGRARARALSLYATAIAAAVVVGQVAGGLLVSADLFGTGWRPVFLINVPVGAALLAAAARLLPREAARTATGLDLPGLVTLTGTLLLLVVPLVLGREQHWPRWAGCAWPRWSRRPGCSSWSSGRWPGAGHTAGARPGAALAGPGPRRGGPVLLHGRLRGLPVLPLPAPPDGAGGVRGARRADLRPVGGGRGGGRPDLAAAARPVAPADDRRGLRPGRGRLSRPRRGPARRRYRRPGRAVAPTALGLGMGFTTSPLLTLALSGIAPADAADASGC
ncbi:MFS transporter [Streptomyces noursei]|nr:MFS transporter [Streptomyces noursei]